jgi:hypothetical protein
VPQAVAVLAAVAALVAAAAVPSTAAAVAWSAPRALPGLPWGVMEVDDRGTLHRATTANGLLIVTSVARSGATRERRVRLPRQPRYPLFPLAFDVSADGGLAVLLQAHALEGFLGGATWIVSARPGRALSRPRLLMSRGTPHDAVARVMPGGRVLASWLERARGGRVNVATVGAPLGGRLGRVRRVPAHDASRREAHPGSLDLAIDAVGRPVWSWLTLESGGDGGTRDQLWSATAARGEVVPRRRIATFADSRPGRLQRAALTTDGRGGQVMVRLEHDASLGLYVRRAGRRFRRVASAGKPIFGFAVAGNRGGDVVIAWDADTEPPSASNTVLALVRRRDGRIAGPQRLHYGESGPETAPSVAIDAAGRALVAWHTRDYPDPDPDIAAVHAAVSSADGRFGAGQQVSGPRTTDEDFPQAFLTSSGLAWLVWRRDTGQDGQLMHSRARLGR